MPRIRTIKPEFWDDEKLASISRDARLTFIGLWTHADDNGTVKAHPLWLKNKIFPYDDIKPSIFEQWLTDLENIRAIIKYTANEENFYYIRKFAQHQVINRPNKTNVNPSPPEDILNNHGTITEESVNDTGVIPSGREGKGKERNNNSACEKSFSEFWNIYPVKTAKQQALKAWEKLYRNKSLPENHIIINSIHRQIEHKLRLKSSGAFCPEWKHPSTWLNGGCWEDECSTSLPSTKPTGAWGKELKIEAE